MSSQYLVCLEVAISWCIHLWESKSASSQPCESSNASPDRCGQEPWVLVVLRGRANAVTSGTFQERVCPAVGCPGRNTRRSGVGWCRRSIGERRNWLFPLGHATVQGCWMLPGVQALAVRWCLVLAPVDMLAVKVANIQTGGGHRRSQGGQRNHGLPQMFRKYSQ